MSSVWYSQCIPADTTPQPPVTTTPEPEVEPEGEGEPEVETEAEPEVEPETPTASPNPLSCMEFCDRLNVSSSDKRCADLTTEVSCIHSYITNRNSAVPCLWNSCGCYADGDSLVDCPELADQCAGVLLQRVSPRRGSSQRRNLRAPLQPDAGAAFVEDGFSVDRAAVLLEAPVDEEEL